MPKFLGSLSSQWCVSFLITHSQDVEPPVWTMEIFSRWLTNAQSRRTQEIMFSRKSCLPLDRGTHQRQPRDTFTPKVHDTGTQWDHWTGSWSHSYVGLRYKKLHCCFARKCFGHTQICQKLSQTEFIVLWPSIFNNNNIDIKLCIKVFILTASLCLSMNTIFIYVSRSWTSNF